MVKLINTPEMKERLRRKAEEQAAADRAAKERRLASPGALMTPIETAERLQVTIKALEHWRGRGDGPQFVRLGRSCVRYRVEDVDAFVRGRLKANTAQ